MSYCDFKTAIVYNNPNKLVGLPPVIYRWRVCKTNFTPADQYQKLKLIQNTVRVNSSLYTSNLGPLNAYQKPISNPSAGLYGVCWNQMSDRPVPSVQKATVPTGFHNSINNRHSSVTSSKPGSQTPGGAGCDIKHNSYDRYLNRLKGKGPLRRGVIPADFGLPLPFNQAFPIYGGKTTKTSIVGGCNCPIGKDIQQNIQIYNNPLWQPDPSGSRGFQVGDYVYAMQTGNNYYTKALITNIIGTMYTIQFDNGATQETTLNQLKIYFPCNCSYDDKSSSFYVNAVTNSNITCSLPTSILSGY